MSNEQKIIVTLSGEDRVGIVMEITTVLAKYNVNVEDIKQTLMQSQFVMFLLGDISKSNYTFKEIKQALLDKANELNMEIWIQKKEIFEKMHNINIGLK